MPPTGPRWYYLGPFIQAQTSDGPTFLPPAPTISVVDLRGSEGGVGFFCTSEPLDSDYYLLGTSLEDEVDGSVFRTLSGANVADGSRSILEHLWISLTEGADPDGLASAPPILPTHRGKLELHLSGHSLVKSRRFLGERDPAWKIIQARLANDYVRVKRNASQDKQVHLKMLGAWELKYRIPSNRLVLNTNDRPLRPTTKYTDDFNRANSSTLGTSAEGWSWAMVATQIGIQDNMARASGANSVARAGIDLSSDDQRVQAVVPSFTVAAGAALLARFSASEADTYYMFRYFANSGNPAPQFHKRISGTFTQLSVDVPVTVPTSFVLKFEVDGSTLRGYKDGVETLTITDTSLSSHLRVGLRGNSSAAYWDDFEAEDLMSESPVLPMFEENNIYIGT